MPRLAFIHTTHVKLMYTYYNWLFIGLHLYTYQGMHLQIYSLGINTSV